MSVQIVKLLDPMNIVNIPGGLVPKGAYSGVTAYSVGDSVSYNGSSYVCITASTGNLPTDTAYWQLVASKGNTGETGLQGPAGTTDYNELDNLPTLGTAAAKDIPATGNASATEVVYGTDTRLTDSRPASDVSAWAKAPSKPTYTKSEVGLSNVDNTSDANKPVSTAQQTVLDTKVDKSSTANVLYGRNSANAEAAIPMTESAATPWTIPRRDGAGRIKVVSAAAPEDAVNKSQMDTADALKVNKAGDTMTGQLVTPSIAQGTAGFGVLSLNPLRTSGLVSVDGEVASGGHTVAKINGKMIQSSGLGYGLYTNPEINQSGTAGYIALYVNTVETTLGTGTKSLISLRSAGNERFKVQSDGRTTINGVDYLTGTGFPNGVVSAPVGSTYIDTAATNGITHWYKLSGSGNTGYVPQNLSSTVPASASAVGIAGQQAYDANYLYICTATNTWKRTPLSSW